MGRHIFCELISSYGRFRLTETHQVRRSTVIFNVTTMILLYTKSIPVAYRDIMAFPSIVIINIMASRIYRNVNCRAFQTESQANGSSIVTDIKFNQHQVVSEGTTLDDVESRKQGVFLQKNTDSFKSVGDDRAQQESSITWSALPSI